MSQKVLSRQQMQALRKAAKDYLAARRALRRRFEEYGLHEFHFENITVVPYGILEDVPLLLQGRLVEHWDYVVVWSDGSFFVFND